MDKIREFICSRLFTNMLLIVVVVIGFLLIEIQEEIKDYVRFTSADLDMLKSDLESYIKRTK